MIDDGSTDSTPQICDEYSRNYDSIHVFHQQNIGLSKTREKLLEKASGEYIFWLDADDYFDPSLLQKAVRKFEIEHADIVVWGYVAVTEKVEIKVNYIDELGIKNWRKKYLGFTSHGMAVRI